MKVLVAAALLLLAGCEQSKSAAVAALPSPSVPTTSSARPSAPTPTPTPRPTIAFRSSVSPIDATLRARMRWSWRPGCPVPLEELRHVSAAYLGFDGQPHLGELVVHRAVASDVAGVLRRLYAARFPIHRMRLVDDYHGDDGRSMAADNTSAFNCRAATGSPGVWSQHSYGRAIDINPVENPYVISSGQVQPAAGADYLDRQTPRRGLIQADDFVVRTFAATGWEWGGRWQRAQDYQHFSQNGR